MATFDLLPAIDLRGGRVVRLLRGDFARETAYGDDPVAVACRHITGVSSIVWGNDYPHAEGTFRGSRELIERLFRGVPADERAAMIGGTLGGLLGYSAPASVS